MIDIHVFDGENVHMLFTWLVVIVTCCLLVGGFLFTKCHLQLKTNCKDQPQKDNFSNDGIT